MRISTFELLLKPITPAIPMESNTPPGEIFLQSDRFVLQGYFLTIANPSDTDLDLRLQFNVTVSRSVRDSDKNNNVTLDNLSQKTFVFLDLGLGESSGIEGNVADDLSRIDGSNQFEFKFTLPGSKTALFLVQPDILPPPPSPGGGLEEIEIRGFSEIFLDSPPSQKFDLLVTPEHRGTFLPLMTSENMQKMQGMKKLTPDLDQLVYPLPTPNGGSLFILGPSLPGPDASGSNAETSN